MDQGDSIEIIQIGNQQRVNKPPTLTPQQAAKIERGKALFSKLEQNPTRQYERFGGLESHEMNAEISDLQTWKQIGGPHQGSTKYLSAQYHQRLNQISRKKTQAIQERCKKWVRGIILAALFSTLISCIADQQNRGSVFSYAWIVFILLAVAYASFECFWHWRQ